MGRTHTLLIDPNKLFREGLKRLLDDSPFEIVAEASNLREGTAIVETDCRPTSFSLTWSMVGTTRPRQCGACASCCPEARIVVLTTELCTRRLTNALGAGADGYLMKDLSTEALAQSLRLVIMGEKVFPTHLAALLISGRVSGMGLETPISRKGLSPREGQILRCLLNGDSNKMTHHRGDGEGPPQEPAAQDQRLEQDAGGHLGAQQRPRRPHAGRQRWIAEDLIVAAE